MAPEFLQAALGFAALLGLPTWWAVGFGAIGFALTAVAALAWVVQLAQGKE